MKRTLLGLFLCLAAASFGLDASGAQPGADGVAFFETKIRPLLAEHCLECHSAERGKTKGGLALDSRAGWEKGGTSGAALVPGDVDGSLLIQAVRRGDADTAMPPKKALPAAAVKALEQWVKLGAPDPREGAKKTPAIISAENLWSLKPVRNPPVPKLAESDWPRTDVDAFLLAALREKQLAPSPDATLDTLARRLWLTLIGLPPTVEEWRTFRKAMTDADDAEAVLAQWVDRLIASPRFAEKWARHWLDVARYAESNGKALNNGLPYAWRYRDWVIAAIHADKPVDRFLSEQIAGDLLAEAEMRSNPVSSATQQGVIDSLRIATGFLAIGSKEQFGGCGSRSVAEVQPEWVDDQLNVLGRGVLGLNIACSRCHDHKFDPVPMRDYYALAGIFFSTDILSGRKGGKAPEFGQTPLFDPDSIPLGDPEKIEALRQVAAKMAKPAKGKKAAAKAPDGDMPKVEWAFGVRDAAEKVNTPIRIAGAWDKHGAVVPRGFLTAVPLAEPTIPAEQSGRLQLAQWLTDPRHPLTSRVFVNRVWQQVFGAGLVSTTDDFGFRGEPPSHPELLDFLAHRFMHEQGWSLKKLVRDFVLSRAFRQSSRAGSETAATPDPANRLLWRMNTRRLDAEAIRDSVLLTSGQLDLTPRQGTAPLLMEGLFKGLSQKTLDEIRASEAQVASPRHLPHHPAQRNT